MIVLDALDSALLVELARNPRIAVLELASRLGVSRNTVHARMKRLEVDGAVSGYRAEINWLAMGLPVLAFVSLEIDQRKMRVVIDELRKLPYVIEAHAATGREDLLVRVAAESHEKLLEMIQTVHAIDGVAHTETALALATPIRYRIQPILDHVAGLRAGLSPANSPA
ncbi:Lrp/AsnC family transcriptional regulator [Rhodococcus opacus]|uniref:Lrp/AsnC family transcriptional regulator n=1 Tax=Rhodococcus opacus TaxID=37919 RepID=A0AAX3YSP2_RHOOP|nr:Lrp/AsnC family transcriptional regulator [Rhodococcus opacus]MCZ4585959.1 Lrp/AsnC family transcriptional regulator [Rhodococcus opacus]WLF52085.1 Lrp/AsnC family transcriptional regulator [Rhodococcus opacus]